ncbi:DeoR/GlpR family DNA-binding transcription regulator [Nesterenkonia sphaerica]|uniref:Lactose phosphotransferase system repressor n=1 Tax=Nesterenkonia sphaerica TaxID=1804988 RepID=A0A5R9AH26_9MICC|nr:DeoR/GlpR family DNA-binding transcription regulator [Nesterenkonia sphaerica]TLP77464.1 DeoR/GlpR transcriptional regulator [Nesterenkonia sphaerica]
MAQLTPERHDSILARLDEGPVTVQFLADQLQVSKETIRRDLDVLQSQGSLQRVHGGAVPAGAASRVEPTLSDRLGRHTAQKQRIAHTAQQFLPPANGGSMILDAGTTTEALANLVADTSSAEGQQRYLITNAVPIAQRLASCPGAQVEILGGTVRGVTGAAVGSDTVDALARRRADVAFIGTNGVDAAFGLSTPDSAEAAVKAALIRAARHRILLADSSKLGQTTLVQFATLAELDVLITDAEPAPDLAEALTEAEVEVVIA